jgi:hypothetical protein
MTAAETALPAPGAGGPAPGHVTGTHAGQGHHAGEGDSLQATSNSAQHRVIKLTCACHKAREWLLQVSCMQRWFIPHLIIHPLSMTTPWLPYTLPYVALDCLRSRSRSPRPYYGLPGRREPPRVGLQMFVAGFNFLSTERVSKPSPA